MNYIYKITNKINNKIYIGKTSYSLEKRFQEHCRDSKKLELQNRPLYSAMRKYGIENFVIELIEECDDENVNARECYWIKYYNACHYGYNATLGGEGACIYNHEEIAEFLKYCPHTIKAVEYFGCCPDVVRSVAKIYNIKLLPVELKINKEKAVVAYDKNTGKLVSRFNSMAEAARWCYLNGKCNTSNSGARTHICACANGRRKSAYGYIWKHE